MLQSGPFTEKENTRKRKTIINNTDETAEGAIR
jgi:hypothetical protein